MGVCHCFAEAVPAGVADCHSTYVKNSVVPGMVLSTFNGVPSTPAQSAALDQSHCSGNPTRPRRTGFVWMYSTI